MNTEEVIEKLRAQFREAIISIKQFRGEYTLEIGKPDFIVPVCKYAKEELGFSLLLDITAVDFPQQSEKRFMLVYHIYNIEKNILIRLCSWAAGDPPTAPSVVRIWKGADWHEREVWDMFGVRFDGHPNLKRILMWEGYPFHPLRKDFPLGGKESEVVGIAFTKEAPLEGGPFVPQYGNSAMEREPRAREVK